MADNAFIANGIGFSTPMDFAASLTVNRGPKFNAICGLFNNDVIGKDSIITLHRYSVRPVCPPNVVTSARTARDSYLFQKITASDGGDDVPVAKLASASADVPAQVTLKINPDVTAGSNIRGYVPLCNGAAQGVGSASLQASPGPLSNLSDNFKMEDFKPGSLGALLQPISLAEGQGIALVQFDPRNFFHNISHYCVIKFKIGSALYNAMVDICPVPPPMASIALMNNTGSGVTVEVIGIELIMPAPFLTAFPVSGVNDAQQYMRLAIVNGLYGGVDVDPTRFGPQPAPDILMVKQGRAYDPLYFQTPIDDNNTTAFDGTDTGDRNNNALTRFIVQHNIEYLNGGANNVAGLPYPFDARGRFRGRKFNKSKVPALKLSPQQGAVLHIAGCQAMSSYYWELEFSYQQRSGPSLARKQTGF